MEKNEYIGLFILLGLLVVGVWIGLVHQRKEQEYSAFVKSDYEKTLGWIKEYSSSPNKHGAHVVYEYLGGQVIHSRKTNVNRKVDACDYDLPQCYKKRFWVIYSRTDASKSLIRMIPVYMWKDTTFPKTLERFE